MAGISRAGNIFQVEIGKFGLEIAKNTLEIVKNTLANA
jgi:hypothetical protein